MSQIFPIRDLETAFDIEIATSPEMMDAQDLWRSMFFSKAPWNNHKIVSKRTASQIANEFARVTTVEFTSEVSGSPRAEWLNTQYQKLIENTNFHIMASKLNAGGELILKPFKNNKNGITWAVIENNCYFPVRYNSEDELMEFYTIKNLVKNNKYYTLVEHNNYDEMTNTFEIVYYAFESNSSTMLGKEIQLSSVPEWAELQDKYVYGNVSPWFIFVKTPFQNDVEQSSRNGVSVYSKAVDAIRKLDELEELTDHEFEAGRLIQHISQDMILDNRKSLDTDKFFIVDGNGMPNEGYIKTYNPTPRIDEYSQREQRLNRDIEFLCQMSYGILSDVNVQARTATEVNKSMFRFFSANKAMQNTWQTVFERAVKIMDEMAIIYFDNSILTNNEFQSRISESKRKKLKITSQGEYQISFFWDDSIISSKEEQEAAYDAELKRLMLALADGIVTHAEVRAFIIENSNYFSKLTPEMIELAGEGLADIGGDE